MFYGSPLSSAGTKPGRPVMHSSAARGRRPGAYRKICPSPTPKFGGRPPILRLPLVGTLDPYKRWNFGEKNFARFGDMNFWKFVKNFNFLELGEFCIREKSYVDASWSLVCVVQIWSRSVEKKEHLRAKNRNPDCPQGNRYYIGSSQKDANGVD